MAKGLFLYPEKCEGSLAPLVLLPQFLSKEAKSLNGMAVSFLYQWIWQLFVGIVPSSRLFKKLVLACTYNWRKNVKVRIGTGNSFQLHLLLYQLTHNMTKDCSWNYHENCKHRTWAEHVLPMFCSCSVLVAQSLYS